MQMRPDALDSAEPLMSAPYVTSLHLVQHLNLAVLAHTSPFYLPSQDTSTVTEGIPESHTDGRAGPLQSDVQSINL